MSSSFNDRNHFNILSTCQPSAKAFLCPKIKLDKSVHVFTPHVYFSIWLQLAPILLHHSNYPASPVYSPLPSRETTISCSLLPYVHEAIPLQEPTSSESYFLFSFNFLPCFLPSSWTRFSIMVK